MKFCYSWIDWVILAAMQRKLRPRLDCYRFNLREQLGVDALNDQEYLDCVRAFDGALQQFVDSGSGCVRESPALAEAVSVLFALFHDRHTFEGTVPLFDNAISGLNPSYFELLTPTAFEKQVVYLVTRDPRDQFAELVMHSVRTRPSMVKSFIRSYRVHVERAKAVVAQLKGDGSRTVRLMSFEAFVCREDFRMQLAEEVESALTMFGFANNWTQGQFYPDRSRRNIGVWKASGLTRQMGCITEELAQYLRPEAD